MAQEPTIGSLLQGVPTFGYVASHRGAQKLRQTSMIEDPSCRVRPISSIAQTANHHARLRRQPASSYEYRTQPGAAE
jgi:hypothetical protein